MLGIFSAIPAIIFGHLALSKFKRDPEKYKGRNLAVSGLILGYIGIVLSIVVAVSILMIIKKGK